MLKSISIFLKLSLVVTSLIILSSCANKVQFGQDAVPGGLGVPGSPVNSGGPSEQGFLDENLSAPDPLVKAVDILFIDDNSGSMSPDQRNITPKFQNFINQLSGVDWQIGITTTDVTSGGLNGSLSILSDASGTLPGHILKPGPDAQATFEHTIQRPEIGDGNERAIIAVQRAVQKRNQVENAGFFRPGAALAVVILSDEDENSDQYGRTINNPVPSGYETWSSEDEPSALFQTFNSVFPGKSITINSIHVMPGDSACLTIQRAQPEAENTAYYANVYASLVVQTGGSMGSICDTSFTGPLEAIGKTINSQLTSVTLKNTPDPTTLVVTIAPNDPTAHWTLSGNKIYFDKSLAGGTIIHAHYKKQTSLNSGRGISPTEAAPVVNTNSTSGKHLL